MAQNDFEKGTNFLFLLYEYFQARIPSNLGWRSFKVIIMVQNNIEREQIFGGSGGNVVNHWNVLQSGAQRF